MKKTISRGQFIDAFRGWDTYKDNFSYEGLQALYEYFEELEENTGEEIELDVVAICCDFSEYESATEAVKEYGKLDDILIDWENKEEAEDKELVEVRSLEWLEDHTQVIKLDNGGVIIQQF